MTDLLRGAGGGKGKSPNRLYYGDNFTIMQNMPSACVDLIYLDPPFSSQRSYNLIYKQATGLPLPEQEEAFCDSWELDPEKEEMARRMPIVLREYGADESLVQFWSAWINALRHTQPHLLAYLVYMTYRLFEMRRILRPAGSIYLHCDQTASHYIKVIMDGVFGHAKFMNEIIWSYRRWPTKSSRYQRMHDTILYYKNSDAAVFNTQFQEPTASSIKRWKGRRQKVTFDETGQRNPTLEDGGMSAGVPLDDVWRISIIAPSAKERLGFPTQKPLALLDRIIKVSSNPDDVIFDPFCGCGTSIYAAHLNGRKWIGCDVAILSVRIVRDVLLKRYGLNEGEHYQVSGIPLTVEGAEDLFQRDPRQFQHWVVEQAGGFASKRHSGDQGVDGRIYFETSDGLKAMVLSVKGGKLTPAYVRELRGTMERDVNSLLGGFICLQEPTKGMNEEAAKAGQFTYLGKTYDRLQIRTVKQLLDGNGFHTPSQVQTMDWKRQGELAL